MDKALSGTHTQKVMMKIAPGGEVVLSFAKNQVFHLSNCAPRSLGHLDALISLASLTERLVPLLKAKHSVASALFPEN